MVGSMDKYGKLLFQYKNSGLKKGLLFLILGVLILIGSIFVYAKIMFYLLGTIFVFTGIYFIFFKGKEGVAIFEKAIVFTGKNKHVIQKNEVHSIEYKKVRIRRSPIDSYFPIIILKDGSSVQLNIFFNNLINSNLEMIMDKFLLK